MFNKRYLLVFLFSLLSSPIVLAAVPSANTTFVITTEEMEISTSALFLILFILFSVISIFTLNKAPGVALITGMYGFVYGLIQASSTNFWLGMIIVAFSCMIGITGFYKIW